MVTAHIPPWSFFFLLLLASVASPMTRGTPVSSNTFFLLVSSNPFHFLFPNAMEYLAILNLQDQVRTLLSQIAQTKKAMKEPPYFDGICLNPTIYLRWVQTLEDYFESKGCSGEESLTIATTKTPRLFLILL